MSTPNTLKLGLQSNPNAHESSFTVWHKVLSWAPSGATGFSILEINGIGYRGGFTAKFHFGETGFSYPLPVGKDAKDAARTQHYSAGSENTDIINEIADYCENLTYDEVQHTFFRA